MSQNLAVLYDNPGPRQRKITWISSIAAVLALGWAAYALIYKPLDDKGQLSMELWGPLIDPSNEYFVAVWERLGFGFRQTLVAAALAIVTSLVLGTVLAVLRIQLKHLLKRRFTGLSAVAAYPLRGLSRLLAVVTRVCVEVFRGLPVVLTIFFVARGLPEFGDHLLHPDLPGDRSDHLQHRWSSARSCAPAWKDCPAARPRRRRRSGSRRSRPPG